MLNFEKMCEIKQILQQNFTVENMIRCVFLDHPELECFGFSCTNEYDDNNYSDYTNLRTVNGHAVDYDGEYDEDSEPKSDLPRVDRGTVDDLLSLMGIIGTEFGHGEDLECHRDSYANVSSKSGRISKSEKAQKEYINSWMTKSTLADEWFLKNDTKFASYYAQDHGPFSPELEMKIFGKTGEMRSAYMYAQAIGKPFSEALETFFTTHAVLGSGEDDDGHFLKRYLVLKEHFKKKKEKVS